MMRWRGVIIAWVLAILAGGAWWSLRERGDDSRTAIDRPLADAIDLDAVDRVEIDPRDGAAIVLEREAGEWFQTAPFRVPIDGYSVRRIAAAAASLVRSARVPLDELDATERERLELDPPLARVTIRAGGVTNGIALGRRTLAGRAWVGFDDAVASVVDANLHASTIEADPRDWRLRTIFEGIGPDVRAVEVVTGDERLRIARDGARWFLEQPFRTRADVEAVTRFIAELELAQASDYLLDEPADIARYGLEPPAARVIVERVLPDGTSIVQAVRVGDPIGVGAADRYGLVEGRPTLLRLEEGVQRTLVPAAAGLVDATASGVDRADIGAIEVQRAEGAFRLVRDFEGWRAEMIGEDGEPTDVVDAPRDAAERLLEQITVARAGALELGYPRELEVAVVILFDYDDRPIDTVRFAREPNAGRWALENGDDVLRVHPPSFDPVIDAAAFGLR